MSFLDESFGELKYEDEGKWLEYQANPDGSIPRIKLRRAHQRHTAYQSGIAAMTARVRGNRRRKLSPDDDEKIACEAYSKYLVMGWENFVCPDSLLEKFGLKKGEFIPFSVQNCYKLMRARPRFSDDIHRTVHNEEFFSEQDEGFSDEADEDSVKN